MFLSMCLPMPVIMLKCRLRKGSKADTIMTVTRLRAPGSKEGAACPVQLINQVRHDITSDLNCKSIMNTWVDNCTIILNTNCPITMNALTNN
jgi:hypothetical protein